MRTRKLGSFLAVFIAVGAVLVPILAAAAPTLQALRGRWSGWGSVVFDGGEKERIKCVATYFVRDGGTQLQQNLRCTTSSSYKISAHSELTVEGRELSGTWVERKSGNEGEVTGRLTDKGFKLSVSGDAFSATMNVRTTTCSQSINISPSGLGIRRISISLGKC